MQPMPLHFTPYVGIVGLPMPDIFLRGINNFETQIQAFVADGLIWQE